MHVMNINIHSVTPENISFNIKIYHTVVLFAYFMQSRFSIFYGRILRAEILIEKDRSAEERARVEEEMVISYFLHILIYIILDFN